MTADRGLRAAVVCAIAVAALLFAVHGHRFVATNDEGILLEPAQRVAAGQAPYVDFFGYMSPGSYWIQAAVFRLFGVSLLAGRIPVILGFAAQCGMVLWLVARLASLRAAVVTALLFFGFQIGDPSFLTAQHRWDSGTLALGAICIAYASSGRRSPGWPLAAGVLLGTAAWCTPSMAAVAVVVLGWYAWQRNWTAVGAACGGMAVVSVAAAALLLRTGSLEAFAEQLLWLRRNYAEVNIMPYGAIIGGYGRIFEGVSGAAAVLTAIFVFFIALPAILPPLAMTIWAAGYRRGALARDQVAPMALLLAAMAALIATAFPRADVMHLALVAALPAALCGAGAARVLPERASGIAAALFCAAALAFASNHARAYLESVPMESPAGTLLVGREMSGPMARILERVRPGETLLVHPYMPVLYFATQARNVTRFSFLAPGMMTAREEGEMLAALEASPPQWVLYQRTARQEFLRVFPHAQDLDNRFSQIDEFLMRSYESAAAPPVQLAGYRLLRRKQPLANTLLKTP